MGVMKKRVFIFGVSLCVLALLVGIVIWKTNSKEEINNGSLKDIDFSKYVTLGDYEYLVVSVKKPMVTEEEVRTYIEDMLKNQEDVVYETLSDEDVERIFSGEGYTTVKQLKDDVIKMLEENEQTNFANSIHNALLEKVKTNCQVKEIPAAILEARVKDDLDDLKKMSEEEGMEFDAYLEKYYQMTEEEYKLSSEEYVRKNLELIFILSAIAQKEGIELDEDGYQSYIAEKMLYFGYKNEKELYEENSEEDRRIAYVCEKVIDWLKESMIVTEEKE